MGAGQIGGIATIVGLDFDNSAGFLGDLPTQDESQFLVYFMSHTMLFCSGVLLEPHVVLTAASCVYSETDKFKVWAGSHQFKDGVGIARTVHNIAIHRGFNKTKCFRDNLALLVLDRQFFVRTLEHGAQFMVNRVNYGLPDGYYTTTDTACVTYGWGSRRNGLMMPMLMNVRRVNLTLLPPESCELSAQGMLCIQEPACKDDVGSVLVCGGRLRGLHASRAVNRPCGYGYVDLQPHNKFIECAVDDAREISCLNCDMRIKDDGEKLVVH